MHRNYTSKQRILTYSLLIGLFLQSCGGFQNQAVPQEKEQPSMKLRVPDNPLVNEDKCFVTSNGYLASFYQEDENLKADLKADEKQPKPNYKGVPVVFEKGTDLMSLNKLDPTIQKKRIEINYSQGKQLRYITIRNGGVAGGMMEDDDGEKEKEAENKTTYSEIIVFCGNPGVGKSTLCNSIFGQAIFESGISIGKGMTTHKQEQIYEHKLYIDTPGLADVEISEQAAEEIKKALKHNNNYKLIFVAMLDSGRVRIVDLLTINTVCDAIKTNFEYGIIFNQVIPKVARELSQKGLTPESTCNYLLELGLHKKPSQVMILTRDEDIEGESNMHFEEKSENRESLLGFIGQLSANRIDKNNVKKLDIVDYEKKLKEVEKNYKMKIAELDERIIYNKKLIQDTPYNFLSHAEEKENDKAEKPELKRKISLESYKKAAEQDDADAQFALGNIYYGGFDVQHNYKQAFSYFEKAAAQGHVNARSMMAIMYYFEQGVVPDRERALELFQENIFYIEKLAEGGDRYAQNMLGLMYEGGIGIDKNHKKAVEWFQKAACQELVYSQYNLGKIYYHNKNYQKALEWYQKAADQGYVNAQNALGLMYQSGQGVRQDYQKALEWYQKAADQGFAIAQKRIELMYEKGKGVTKDKQASREWFQKADDQGQENPGSWPCMIS